MCLILDTNRFGDALSVPPDERYAPLIRWLLERDGSVVFGGTKYRGEISKNNRAQKFFAELLRAGRAYQAKDGDVDAKETALKASGICTSDDEHIIATAQVGGARTICTEDTDLIADIGNRRLLNAPRGRIYRAASHSHLLQHDSCCPRSPAIKRARRNKRRRRKSKH